MVKVPLWALLVTLVVFATDASGGALGKSGSNEPNDDANKPTTISPSTANSTATTAHLTNSGSPGSGHRIPRPAPGASALDSSKENSTEADEAAVPAPSSEDLKAKIESLRKEAAENADKNENNSDETAPEPHKTRVLQGSIDQYGEAKQQAFNIGLGIVAKKEQDSKSGSRILQILPSSPAQQGGVRAGDHILKETLDKDVVHLSLLRAGKTLEVSLKTGGAAMFELTADQPALQTGAHQNLLHAGTTTTRLKANVVEQMRDHDVSLILDMSGSMTSRDCQGLSRWDWVGAQSNELALAAQQASSDLTVFLFSSQYQVMEHVNPALIPLIFQRVRPGGGTMLSPPLNDALTRYFAARDANPKTKPLIVTIITDGLPGDYTQVKQIITNAANATRRDGEVSITFLLVNGSLSGNRQMEDLDSQLGTQRDIVNLVEFDQVLQLGVKQALFEALSGRQLKNAPLSAPMNPYNMLRGMQFGGRNLMFPGGKSGPYNNMINPTQYGMPAPYGLPQNGLRSYP